MTGVLTPPEDQAPRRISSRIGPTDLVFRVVARSGGALVLVIMVLVGTFLAYRAWQALRKAGFSFLTTQDWNPDGGRFGIAAVIVGTILIAAWWPSCSPCRLPWAPRSTSPSTRRAASSAF